ncbi:MAG: hypothetical protein KIG32_02160 [Ruminiclostridium sp.]|nr:hypothetical protein [Ruminiclostridium sp.]
MKILGIARLVCCVAAVVIQILPLGAVLRFGITAQDGTVSFSFENYSYFDITPFGYAMFNYMICAVFTAIASLLSIVRTVTKSRRQTPVTVLSAIALAMSLIPYIFGAYNIFTIIVSVLLAAVVALSVTMHCLRE